MSEEIRDVAEPSADPRTGTTLPPFALKPERSPGRLWAVFVVAVFALIVLADWIGASP
jgi:hypothetical protein